MSIPSRLTKRVWFEQPSQTDWPQSLQWWRPVMTELFENSRKLLEHRKQWSWFAQLSDMFSMAPGASTNGDDATVAPRTAA